MIHLITGLPGGGKTLNTIKEVIENKRYQGRPIFYWNINELQYDWTLLTKEEAENWVNLPDNSVVVIDEVQKIFRVRQNKSAPIPHFVTALEDHRHRGFDFIVNSQFPMQVDTHFRKLVGLHWHFERQFGISNLRKFVWQKCVNDPAEDHFARQDATKQRGKLDKKYFNKYKSAEVHTHKPQLPKKLFVVACLAIAFIALAFSAPSILLSKPEKPQIKDSISNAASDFSDGLTTTSAGIVESSIFQDSESYLKALTPVIPDQPNTAPIYAELHEPVTMPRLNCLAGEINGRMVCKCYSQQATKFNISDRACLSYVVNGYSFDYTLPDRTFIDTPPAQAEEGESPSARVTVVPQSGTASFPTANNSFGGIQ